METCVDTLLTRECSPCVCCQTAEVGVVLVACGCSLPGCVYTCCMRADAPSDKHADRF
ncbi:hypothetical protein BKA80DRAFT_133864 [Phyllosticta citrichinensis]